MQIFYAPEISEGITHFNEVESRHAVRVLRLKRGDEVHVIDGKGSLYLVKITEPDQRKCAFDVLNVRTNFEKRDYYLHIGIAPTKNIVRLEWFLEKATEIGVDEITPLLCDHSERKILKPERLQKIIVSAAKQSLKAYVPKLNPLTKLEDFLEQSFDGNKLIAHCYEMPKTAFKESLFNTRSKIAIGPEGDFSELEVSKALTNNFTTVSLGTSRLRTETAGIVACHTVNLMLSK